MEFKCLTLSSILSTCYFYFSEDEAEIKSPLGSKVRKKLLHSVKDAKIMEKVKYYL